MHHRITSQPFQKNQSQISQIDINDYSAFDFCGSMIKQKGLFQTPNKEIEIIYEDDNANDSLV